MKRYLIGFTVALLALSALLVGCTGVAPSAPPVVGGVTGISLSQQSTGIWVTGEGKVTVVPDVAILTLGVETQATTVAEAQSQAATSMDAVMKELRRLGVAEKDIKTQQFSIFPVKRFEKEREILIGYRVTNMVTAKVRKVADTGSIIDAVAKAGGDFTRINSISFTVDDPSAFLKQAREKAMKDAEAKAKQLADLSSVRLGKPTFINESGGYFPIIRSVMKEAMAGAPAPAPTTPITPGETEIQLNVQVVYSIL